MDIVQVKENIPQSADIPAGVVFPNKMPSSSTPRLPLADLKQAARPCSNQTRKSRSSFPLLTPNGKKAIRKSQPVTLVYQEDKENEFFQEDSKQEAQDEQLDEFVLSVLNKCSRAATDKETDASKTENDAALDCDPQLCSKQLDTQHVPVIQNTPRLNTDPSQQVDNEKNCNEVQNGACAAIDSSILAEEFLLGETPNTSAYSDNCYDSSKSEEELLAQTPAVESGTAADRGTMDLCNRNVDELKDAVFTVKTPKVNFLEQAALTERVKKATHSIGSFVMHKENMLPELKLTWTEGGRATLVQKFVDTDSVTYETEVFNKSMNTEMCTPERKGSHSVACSPLPMMQHEVGIQNCVDVNSVFCSPMPIPSNDVSTQNETETQSTLCSPIRFPHSDTSTQAVVETRSVMCTPIRIPVRHTSTQNVSETQSISCSPMVIPVAEASTQNVVETQSVLCSPMVPCPSEDKSILVSGPELVDLCIGTEIIDTRDEEVSVQPDTNTVSTSMEDCPMVSCGTIMTPLKVTHKQGKRMTADDVRKQHPRVLANELDTLRTQNERLEGRVLSLKQDVKKLASFEEVLTDLEAARGMLEKERDLYWKEYGEWKSKCELLESENETLKTAHSQEISDMKERYENHDYYSHFLSSQKLVGELQAELDEYKELLPELEQSQKLLNDLKTQYSGSFSKLKQAHEKLTQRKVELAEKEAEITNLKSVCDKVAERNMNIEKEREETAKTISELKSSIAKLEEEVKTKNEALRKLDESNECVKTQANAIINLEHTIDDHEKEIDMLEKDLFECREVICKQMEERNGFESREKLQTKELKSLKHENNGLKDCLARLRAQEQEAKDGWTMVQEELSGTKEHASRIIKQQGTEIAECSSSIGQLMDHMTSVLADLKKRAGFEDEDCCIEESQTTKKSSKPKSMPLIESESVPDSRPVPKKKFAPKRSFVSQILQAVQTADPETSSVPDQVTGTEDDSEKKTIDKTTSGNKELVPVSDNLGQTVNQSDGNAATLGTDNVVHKGSSNGYNLDVSSNSAFRQVKSSDESQNQPEVCQIDKDDKNITRRNNQVLKKKANIVNSFRDTKTQSLHAVSKCQEKGSEPSAVIEGENKLSDQLRKMTEMFKQVMHVASLIEKALRSSLQDMRSEDYELRGKVSQCEYSEKRARAQLEIIQSELETSRKLVKQKQALLDEQSAWLEGMLDTQSVAEKQAREREIRILRSKIHSLEGEKDIMNEQFNKLLQKVQSNSAEKSASVDVDAHKEIIILKKKADKYRLSMLDREELIVSERIKANERVLKMEANWKKADAEVMRLYDRIDRVRSALVVSKNFAEDPDLQKVIEVIDGLEKDSGSLLKPMKTSRW